VLPAIGARPLIDLHKRDINSVIVTILERGRQVEAARVFGDLLTLLRWGTAQGYLDTNPAEGMRRPAARPPRERVLSDAEIRKLWNILPTALRKTETTQHVIKLCLLTGQRVGECSGIQPSEIDGDTWTIPAARAKNGCVHEVPLTPLALEFALAIAAAPKPAPHSISTTIRLAQDRFGLEHWTAHDLRRTVVTNMARLGVPPIVLGHVINHRSVTRAGITLSVYSHYDYSKEKREALDLWAKRLAEIVR
jgi:integrase